jgi:DNA adenine methylase
MRLYSTKTKPFLKWAGGKGQLLDTIKDNFPRELMYGEIKKYVEPFIGGGAVFFLVAQFYDFEELYIADINKELILAYKTIKNDVESLIDKLEKIKMEYVPLPEDKRKEYFYAVRKKFNKTLKAIDFKSYQPDWVERTAQIIFLNRTCFNGLFRVNSKGEFNVPFGKYKNPKILDAENLRVVSELLQRAKIKCGDFTTFEELIDESAFVYFDPPYRPLSETSSFTSYSQYTFDDNEQVRLANYYLKLSDKGAKLMLSNSDPKNVDQEDNFFDDAYAGFVIKRVKASRNINSKGTSRGKINELLIMNY